LETCMRKISRWSYKSKKYSKKKQVAIKTTCFFGK